MTSNILVISAHSSECHTPDPVILDPYVDAVLSGALERIDVDDNILKSTVSTTLDQETDMVLAEIAHVENEMLHSDNEMLSQKQVADINKGVPALGTNTVTGTDITMTVKIGNSATDNSMMGKNINNECAPGEECEISMEDETPQVDTEILSLNLIVNQISYRTID